MSFTTADGGSAGLGSAGIAGGAGIVGGAADGGSGFNPAHTGGVDGGGGGAGGYLYSHPIGTYGGGGGGGVGGAAGSSTYGGNGGFGGGGGGGLYGGVGGFGGGGGAGYYGGNGGFGGGGAGGGRYGLGGATGLGGFGAGNGSNTSRYGGGGLGAGGAVFVQQGGRLTFQSGSISGGSATGGSGGATSIAADGSGFGSGIFLQGNQTLDLAPGNGFVLDIADMISDESVGGGAGIGAISIGGGGRVVLSATNSFAGGVMVTAATLELGAAGAAGSGEIDLVGNAAVLAVAHNVVVGNVVLVTIGDVIDADGITDATASFSGGILTIAGTGGSLALTLANPHASTAGFTAVNDGNGGVAVTMVACYCPGTRIATPGGAVMIEDLSIGDFVLTHKGEARPVKWIGRRAYRSAFVAANPQLRPVRILANAIAPNVPARDLLVSAQHGVLADLAGGALIPAGALVNGRGILRDPAKGGVAYLHVELADHELILAEGLAAETFIDCVGRGIFENAEEFAAIYPGAVGATPSFDVPRLEHGFAVAAIQRGIAARAGLADAGPRPGVLRGHVERIVAHPEGLLVEGWAMDAADPQRVQELEFLRVGMAPLPVVANHYRVDLDHAGLADGCYGFSQLVSAGSGDILVRRVADGAMLPGPFAIGRAA